jgi:putative peptidoglycan lipid II flippase
MRPGRQSGTRNGLPAAGPAAPDDDTAPEQAAAAAGDSITVAAWTIVSRVTGVARFACIGAVLGPTFFGNTYQFTNSLPNLVYYGFLAGSLFSSLLVPALVRHIDSGDRRGSERVAGGFLGMTLVALVVIAPVAIFLGPLVLRFAALGVASHVVGAAQARVGQLLIIMFAPQIFFYGVVGTATAVMNSRQRFALAAGAPAVENLGTIAVLLLTAVIYGTGTGLASVSRGEMLLLGLGSTGAVALHAATQWWGARRAGVVLLPRAGWRDPEVRIVIRRALPSLAQAGLVAFQVLTLLVVANRLAGGVVAFQIALNFYYLAIAVGATPVALSLLPRLARMHLNGDMAGFRDTLVRGLALGFFITIPAAVGYLALALPLARAVSFGRMSGAAGVTMVAVSLAALSVAVVGQTAFMIATYASYAKKDTRSPLISMLLQAVVCLGLVTTALLAHGLTVLVVLGLALSAAVTIAACHLTARLFRGLRGQGNERLTSSLVRFLAGAVVMVGPAWLVASEAPRWLGRPFGPRLGLAAAALVGVVVYLSLQAWWRTPELTWLAGGFAHLRAKARRRAGGVTVNVPVTDGMTGIADVVPRHLPRRPERGLPPPPALAYTGGRLRWRGGRWVAGPAVIAAAVLGTGCALRPLLTLAVVLVLALIAAVWARPALAAYLVIVVTPLTVGISRGAAIPVLRPNEALAFLVGGTLVARGLVRLRSGQWPRLRLDRVEVALVLMAVANSVVPLLWMTVRQQPITQDDLEYALVLWKLLGLYAIVRAAVTTDRQVRRCLWLSVAAACMVATLAIFQSLGLFGVPGLLEKFYQSGVITGLQSTRGASTLGLPAATADLCIFNLAVVTGLWMRFRRWRPVLAGAAALLVMGALSAGEFSSAIGLVLGLVCIAIVTRRPRLLAVLLPAGLGAGFVLWPVIAGRLSGFQSASGLPVSWTTRLQNLQTYFWPTLFSHWNFVLGVRPGARIAVPSQVAGFVWIESGYTWLLWGGGIPLVAGFLYFVYAVARRGRIAARGGNDGRSVAGIAVFAAIFVIAVLMTFDPHLTYRGSGDAFFIVLALAAPWARRPGSPGEKRAAAGRPLRGVGSPGDPAAKYDPMAVPIAGQPGRPDGAHGALVLTAAGGRAPTDSRQRADIGGMW